MLAHPGARAVGSNSGIKVLANEAGSAGGRGCLRYLSDGRLWVSCEHKLKRNHVSGCLLVVACHAPRLHVSQGEMCIMRWKCTALTLSLLGGCADPAQACVGSHGVRLAYMRPGETDVYTIAIHSDPGM